MLKTCRDTGFPLRYFLKPIHWWSKAWPADHSPHCIPINTPFNARLQWFANIDQYIPLQYIATKYHHQKPQKKNIFQTVRPADCGCLGPVISMLWNHEKNPSKFFGFRTISIRRPRSAANANSAKLRKTETEGQHGCVWKLSLNRNESEMFCLNATNSRQILDYCNYCSSQWIYNGSWRYSYRVWRYTDVPWNGGINLQSRGDFVFLD